MNKRDETPASALQRVVLVAHRLESLLDAALAKVGLSGPKLGVLEALAAAGEPLTLSGLAAQAHCVRSNITQLVDRLEKDGLVRRIGDSSDRRIRRASLTAAGRKAHADGMRVLVAQQRETARVLTEADARDLARVLARLES